MLDLFQQGFLQYGLLLRELGVKSEKVESHINSLGLFIVGLYSASAKYSRCNFSLDTGC